MATEAYVILLVYPSSYASSPIISGIWFMSVIYLNLVSLYFIANICPIFLVAASSYAMLCYSIFYGIKLVTSSIVTFAGNSSYFDM